jgi:hypothetical protein
MKDMSSHEERTVRDYVNSQAPPEDQVTFVQKLGTRKVVGRTHALFDVRTERGRWWVITEPTNLYSQEDFRSIEVALTYHLGIEVMLAERGRKEFRRPQPGQIAGAWRRFERAVDAYNDADEAEAFQAVGVHCREALLALAREEARTVPRSTAGEFPKGADFKGWTRLLFSSIHHERARAYLVSAARQ